MKFQEFAFYLGVFSVNPVRLMSYKIEDPAVLDVFQKADSVVDIVFGGDVHKFLLALEDGLNEQLFVEGDTLSKISFWLNGITTMRLD